MRNNSIVFISMCMLGCGEITRKNDILERSKVDTLLSLSKVNGPVKGIDTIFYINNGDPDTALVFFLYKDCFAYDYDSQREGYMRLDSEKVIMPLFELMFKMKPDYKTRLHQVKKNSKRFLMDARKDIFLSYKNYSSVTNEMVFEYLLRRKDAFLKSILIKMVHNKAVSEKEKNEIKKILETWN